MSIKNFINNSNGTGGPKAKSSRHRKIACFVFSALAAWPLYSPAGHTADVKTMDILDFIVDWPTMVGQPVIITGGNIEFFTEGMALLTNGTGSSILLRPPWSQREDLRFLLKNCAGFGSADVCKITVGGIVENGLMPNQAQLTNVDFLAP